MHFSLLIKVWLLLPLAASVADRISLCFIFLRFYIFTQVKMGKDGNKADNL